MKKSYLFLALALPLAIACSDSDDDVITPNTDKQPLRPAMGMLALNSGNTYSGIDGSLHMIANDTIYNKLYQEANGKSLGGTPNDIVIYGSKTYIVSTGENAVFVLDSATGKELTRISTTQLMGENEGRKPRHLCVGDGKVFVSAYSAGDQYSADYRGHVADIDTLTYASSKTIELGSYPEGISYLDGKLYAANSGYSYGGATISIVDWTTGATESLTLDLLDNPTDIVATDDGVYVLNQGHYGPAPTCAQEGTGLFLLSADGTSAEKVAEGTMMDAQTYYVDGKRHASIALLNAPYGLGTTGYSYYLTQTNQNNAIEGISVDSPSAIGVDASNGEVYVASLPMGEYGSADYSGQAYVVVYDLEGKQLARHNNAGNGSIVKFARIY